MKKIILTFVTAFFIISSVKAVPLTIINDTQNYECYGEYEVFTYLGFMTAGDTCYDSRALPFIFAPNSQLIIDNGSFIYQSPINNNTDCISSFLGYAGCPTIALDWVGQRFNGFKPFIDGYGEIGEYEDFPWGTLGLSTGGIECAPNNLSGNIIEIGGTPDLYFLKIGDPDDDCILRISYVRFGSLFATLLFE